MKYGHIESNGTVYMHVYTNGMGGYWILTFMVEYYLLAHPDWINLKGKLFKRKIEEFE